MGYNYGRKDENSKDVRNKIDNQRRMDELETESKLKNIGNNKTEKRSFFSRPEKNELGKENILNKKILYLYFGFHPTYYKSGDLEIFHPFFYAALKGKPIDFGVIIEYGEFKDNEKGTRGYFWGESGLSLLEKTKEDFKAEYKLICKGLVGEDFKLEKWELLVSDEENGPLPENITLENFLSKVDPDKQKYTAKNHSYSKQNCFDFCLDIIKQWRLKPAEKKELDEYIKYLNENLNEYGSKSKYYKEFKPKLDELINAFKENMEKNS